MWKQSKTKYLFICLFPCLFSNNMPVLSPLTRLKIFWNSFIFPLCLGGFSRGKNIKFWSLLTYFNFIELKQGCKILVLTHLWCFKYCRKHNFLRVSIMCKNLLFQFTSHSHLTFLHFSSQLPVNHSIIHSLASLLFGIAWLIQCSWLWFFCSDSPFSPFYLFFSLFPSYFFNFFFPFPFTFSLLLQIFLLLLLFLFLHIVK